MVRGRTIAQGDELPQPSELSAGEVAHAREAIAVADHGTEGDEEHLGQGMLHTPSDPQIGQRDEELFEVEEGRNFGWGCGNGGIGDDGARLHPHFH